MCKHKVLFLALLSCFGGLAIYGQSSPIKVEIRLAKTTIKNNEELSVSTALRNASKEEQVLEVWACGYPNQWIADNPSVHVIGEGCLKNTSFRVRLEPGKAFERAVSVRVQLAAGKGQAESVTFRLGIVDGAYGSAWTVSQTWSNSVTVSVTK